MFYKLLINFHTIFLWCLDFIYLSFIRAPKLNTTDVLLVRLDNIGDFVLWIPMAAEIRKNLTGRRITLVCNNSFYEFAKNTKYFDFVIPVDTYKFMVNLIYRLGMIGKIQKLNTHVTIHPNYSRNFLKGDSIVRASNSKEKIGFNGDFSNTSIWERKISDHWYTNLIDTTDKHLMEIERNIEFLKGLGINYVNLHRFMPETFTSLPKGLIFNENYFIIFPGSSWMGRKWKNESFAKVGRKICEEYNYKMLVCGVQTESNDAQSIIKMSRTNNSINLAGKTTLSQFCELVRNAKILIGNETSAIHIAALMNTPSVCILGGGHYGRFLPYSENTPGAKPVPVIKKMECYGCNWKCIYFHDDKSPVPCVSEIESNDVIQAVKKII
jgi:ADP-heptose:LPS heptosyltransferase